MTRINVGIDPRELPDKLLIAEHREITRVPNVVASGKAKLENIPPRFTLGTGHVKFFYTRLAYLQKRYSLLLAECRRRGFQVTDKSSAFEKKENTSDLFNDYQETIDDRQLIIERIRSKGVELLPI